MYPVQPHAGFPDEGSLACRRITWEYLSSGPHGELVGPPTRADGISADPEDLTGSSAGVKRR